MVNIASNSFKRISICSWIMCCFWLQVCMSCEVVDSIGRLTTLRSALMRCMCSNTTVRSARIARLEFSLNVLILIFRGWKTGYFGTLAMAVGGEWLYYVILAGSMVSNLGLLHGSIIIVHNVQHPFTT